MKKTLLLVVAVIIAINLSYGQSFRALPIYRYFNAVAPDSLNPLDSTTITYGGWSIQSVTGTKSWYVGHYTTTGNYYGHCNGFVATGQTAQEQWFISPGFSTVTYPNAKLRFSSCQKFDGTSIAVLVSTDYNGTGLPATGTWTDITSSVILPPLNLSGARTWYNSGNVSLSAYSGSNVYVAFKYVCLATTATDWEVDSISIVNSTSGIQDLAPLKNSISVYPNPVSSVLYLNNIEGVQTITLSNVIGEAIENITVNGNTTSINVSSLKKGLYFITFMNAEGIVTTKKFSKE